MNDAELREKFYIEFQTEFNSAVKAANEFEIKVPKEITDYLNDFNENMRNNLQLAGAYAFSVTAY